MLSRAIIESLMGGGKHFSLEKSEESLGKRNIYPITTLPPPDLRVWSAPESSSILVSMVENSFFRFVIGG